MSLSALTQYFDGKPHHAPWMLAASATLFGLMAFSAKLAAATIGGAEIAAIRFAICLIPMLIVPAIRRQAWHWQRVDLLFYRGFFGGVAVLFYFLAIEHIPVGVATLLNYTAPVFSGFFAAAFIGEPVRARVVIPLAVTFSGVFLVVQSFANPGETIGFGRWEFLGLCSAILSGAAVTAIRAARRTEGSWSIFASFTLFGLLVSFPIAIRDWTRPTKEGWLLLTAVGLSSIAAQLLMTYALKWVDTLRAGVISQLAVVVSMILGYFLLKETISTSGLIGSFLTLGGVVAVIATAGSGPRPSAFDEVPEQ